MNNQIIDLVKSKFFVSFIDWHCLIVNGEDSEEFLNGQLTCNVKKISPCNASLFAYCSLSGNLESWGIIFKESFNNFKIFGPNEFFKNFKEKLEKFIIMESVTILDCNDFISINYSLNDIAKSNFCFFGLPVNLKLNDVSKEAISWKEFSFNTLLGVTENLRIGQPVYATSLMPHAVDFNKGCFVGQETLSKIVNNRGSAKFPMFVELESYENIKSDAAIYFENKEVGKCISQKDKVLLISMSRDFRIFKPKIKLKLDKEERVVNTYKYPVVAFKDLDELAKGLKKIAFDKYSLENKPMEAIEIFEMIKKMMPNDLEVIESLGAILGNEKRYHEAISLMDELEKKDPKNIMAHTNKSVYYMKLGEIEKAEQEKAIATTLSFEQGTSQSNTTDHEKELKRIEMFEEVIKIDPKDEFAISSLSELYFKHSKLDEIIHITQELLDNKTQNPSIYLCAGKAFIEKRLYEQAKEVITQGLSHSNFKGKEKLLNELKVLFSSL